MDMYKRKFWLDQEQPNLGYADVKLNITCMHPLACLHTLSLCVYCDLYGVNVVEFRGLKDHNFYTKFHHAGTPYC